MIMHYREIVFCFLTCTMSIILIAFSQNILVQSFNTKAYLCLPLGKKLMYYLIPGIGCAVGSVVSFFLSKVMNRKVIMFYAIWLAGVFMFLCGPSYVFGLYDNSKASVVSADNNYVFKLQISGYAMVGLFVGVLVYPIMSEIFCLAHIKEGILNDITLIDKASGVFSIFFGLGELLAVVLGNFLIAYIKNDPFNYTVSSL